MSYRLLIGTFSISTLILIFKLIISKRLRVLTKNILIGTSFTIFFLTGTGSLVALVMKPREKKRLGI